MTQANTSIEKSKEVVEEVVEQVAKSPWTERVARFGYATKGFVYMVVGATPLLTGLGEGEQTSDARGALQTIEQQPFGKFMLGTVAFGLVGYVIWRLIQAIADADEKGSDLKGISIRIGYAFSGLVYAGLAWSAAKILIDVGETDSSTEQQQDWTARVLSVPYGRWLVGLVGAGVIVFGLYQIYKGWKAKFRKRLKLSKMGQTKQLWATLLGRTGYIARGVVFCLAGAFLIQAAWSYNSEEVQGLDGVLKTLASQSYGKIILGVVAVGLFAYGFYMLVEARYRRIGGA